MPLRSFRLRDRPLSRLRIFSPVARRPLSRLRVSRSGCESSPSPLARVPLSGSNRPLSRCGKAGGLAFARRCSRRHPRPDPSPERWTWLHAARATPASLKLRASAVELSASTIRPVPCKARSGKPHPRRPNEPLATMRAIQRSRSAHREIPCRRRLRSGQAAADRRDRRRAAEGRRSAGEDHPYRRLPHRCLHAQRR